MRKVLATVILAIGGLVGVAHAAEAPEAPEVVVVTRADVSYLDERPKPEKPKPIVYRHGDCSWVRPVALEAGWQQQDMKKLIHIIKRESGCCPRRIGGSVVDKDCNQIKMATWKHPSDSGLLQINGVHWKPDHAQYHGLVCKEMGICTQEPLLDPLTNLRAGRLLFEVAGWSPWALTVGGSD